MSFKSGTRGVMSKATWLQRGCDRLKKLGVNPNAPGVFGKLERLFRENLPPKQAAEKVKAEVEAETK